MNSCSSTHRGLVRANNEDRFLVKKYDNGAVLLAVADGMGRHAAGERAAEIAIQSRATFNGDTPTIADHLTEMARDANRKILEMSARDISLTGMGTTLTAAFVTNGVAHWIHVGDSRCYLFREGELVQVTEDHTVAGLLLRAGEMSPDEARVHPGSSMLMSCLGRSECEADGGTLELMDGDLLLLSTDGLHDRVAEQDMVSILRKQASLEDRLDALIHAALASGGRDNITVVAAELHGLFFAKSLRENHPLQAILGRNGRASSPPLRGKPA